MFKDRIAIIGIGCRFPGGVSDSESFWKLLCEGRDAVTAIPLDRWRIEQFFDSEPGLPGKSIAKRGGFLESIDQFDPQFFGISPREAPFVDPQHRLLLETAWEAIENAGMLLDFEKGTDLGVFVGISHHDYQEIQHTPFDHSGYGPHSQTGCAYSIAANRISYCLNLRGPSLAVDTACSSALTAVHLACEHIRAGHGDAALAGAVTVMIVPGGFIGFSQASMLSPDGRCKAFDAAANGFVRGEGAGMLLLKRLSRAIEDGDPIYGVIIGSALNQDGHTKGISLPSAEAQAKLITDACAAAGISPLQVGFVEAHGTGTAAGDPIEAEALAQALCCGRAPELPLLIGSVKTNLGHLETAAGLAGLLKALLVLKHRKIPASLHFETPNPHIDFAALKLRIPTSLEPFPDADDLRVAGVNSFGFGGANAHVLLEEAPNQGHARHADTLPNRAWPLVLSARSEESLRSYAMRLAAWFDERSAANGDSPALPDLAYTLGARRNHHPHRLTLVAGSVVEAVRELTNYGTGAPGPKIQMAFSPRPAELPRVGFVFSGQGPQWWGMGRELLRHEPVFREVIERCDAAMRPYSPFSLIEELGRSEEDNQMSRTEIAQPAILAIQAALAGLWKAWGVQPAAVVGHSVGEIAAAFVAGVLTLEQAARIIVLRARLMENCARGEGTMLAVGMDKEAAQQLIFRHDRAVSIAAYNGPNSLTLAGSRKSLEAIAAELERGEIFSRFVRVDHPFHHPLMQPASETLERELADLEPRQEEVPFFSTVSGRRCTGAECVASHWGRGIRQPVEFASAVDAMAREGIDVWLELSPQPALIRSLQDCLTGHDHNKTTIVSSIRREGEHESLLETAMALHRTNVPLNFAGMTPSRRLLPLPAYAWDKSRWWNEDREWNQARNAPVCGGLLDARLPRAIPTWVTRLDSRQMAFLKDHKVENLVVFPAAGFVEMALEAGNQMFASQPFVLEDFEIRKPLILPDPVSGLRLELSYDPTQRTFSIQSKLPQGTAWSLHVTGSMRSERTESSFGSSTWQEQSGRDLVPISTADLYQRKSELGLTYGEEFRPVRGLAAGGGQAEGRAVLSEKCRVRAHEYLVHPVLLDGALHVFSAGTSSVQDSDANLKLPVRFSKILFLLSPGETSRVRATVYQANSQYVEGQIELYDEAGRPCLLVEGFRAISVAGAQRSGTENALYHLGWERSLAKLRRFPEKPIPLASLREAAQNALNQVIAGRGLERLRSAMEAVDELAAAQLASGIRRMAIDSGTEVFSVDALQVIEPMQPMFEHFLSSLAGRDWLEKHEDGYRPTAAFKGSADSAPDVLRRFIADHPGYLPEALLCVDRCEELGPLLRGEKDAVQMLCAGTSADLLEHSCGEGLFTRHWLAAISAALQRGIRHSPEGRKLRILEIGGGMAGLAAQVLSLIAGEEYSYTFTDCSLEFLAIAKQKLARFQDIEYRTFDLEELGSDSGFSADGFDFVIGANVLHAARDLRSALGNIHTLLAPGGTLVLTEIANPHLWTQVVFGPAMGLRRLPKRNLSRSFPGRIQWEEMFQAAGFAEASILPALMDSEGQFGLLARKNAEEETHDSGVLEIHPGTVLEKSWLICADSSTLGDQLAERLHKEGAQCRVVQSDSGVVVSGVDPSIVPSEAGSEFKPALQAYIGDVPPERIVFLWSKQAEQLTMEESVALGTNLLLDLVQAVDRVSHSAKVQIDLVTRGAQPVGRTKDPVAVAQGPLLGMLRVILNEFPNFSGRGIDLPPEASVDDFSLLWNELIRTDAEREVAFRREFRYGQRLMRGRGSRCEWIDPERSLRLISPENGQLDSLGFKPFVLPGCGPGQVLIEVKAAGVNFRDVLKVLALYPNEAPDARFFGDEVAGIVRAVGDGVDHVAPGDRVFGLAEFGLATHTLARSGDIRHIPGDLSFEEAATIPVVFMTAWHALQNVARIRKGESILVQAGAGGVGMAAIQIAHYLGAEVIATAGNSSKRALLEKLGVKHVIDSRRGDFAEAVMKLTGRRGVDVVLNALAGEAIPMGLSCLGKSGRFVEIGKRDIYQNSRIPLWPLRRNASFHVVAMESVFSDDEELTRRMLEEISILVERSSFHPLPFRSFPACRIDAAFRLMAQGKHIGKVLIAFSQPFLPQRMEPLHPEFKIDRDGSYLITGAFGGFGKVVAKWLAEAGAQSLLLAGRTGDSSSEANAFVRGLRDRGIAVTVFSADVGSRTEVERMMASIRTTGRPLRGVFHLAMVIDDAPLVALTPERMQSVLRPKAYGAWLLHEATLDLKLEWFVMFSSVSSIFGNPAQANYAAANAFLDSLGHYRRALGLPALVINWGALGEEGYVARNRRVAEYLAGHGTSELSAREVTELMKSSLTAGDTQVMAARVDWSRWRHSFRNLQESFLLKNLLTTAEREESPGRIGDYRERIEAAEPEQKEAIVGKAVRDAVASVLRVKPETLRNDQQLTDLGLDSLMGVEIENAIEISVGVKLPPASLTRARTIGQIVGLLLEYLSARQSPAIAPQKTARPVLERSEEVDLTAISDEEIARLLQEEAGAETLSGAETTTC